MQTIENGNVVARAPAGDQSIDLREVLRALRAMRDGDFSVRLPVNTEQLLALLRIWLHR